MCTGDLLPPARSDEDLPVGEVHAVADHEVIAQAVLPTADVFVVVVHALGRVFAAAEWCTTITFHLLRRMPPVGITSRESKRVVGAGVGLRTTGGAGLGGGIDAAPAERSAVGGPSAWSTAGWRGDRKLVGSSADIRRQTAVSRPRDSAIRCIGSAPSMVAFSLKNLQRTILVACRTSRAFAARSPPARC